MGNVTYNTWEQQTCNSCKTHEPPNIEVVKTVYTRELIVEVLENFPTAHIDIFQDPNFLNRNSPYKVKLTARNVLPGSFPIERIDWDLGDGTPIKSQKRWAINTDTEFEYSDVFFADWRDPRNYDINHVYETSPGSNLTFYPSLTCYASSTGSYDCVKGIVGPINPSPILTENDEANNAVNKRKPLNLIQNELTDHGKVLLGELDCTAVIWRYNK
jgi:hypothetical protein